MRLVENCGTSRDLKGKKLCFEIWAFKVFFSVSMSYKCFISRKMHFYILDMCIIKLFQSLFVGF